MMRRVPAFAAMLLLAGCSGGGDTSPVPSEPVEKAASLYSEHVAPIFQTRCATCHLTGEEQGKLSLVPARAIESLVSVPSLEAPDLMRIAPGEPDKSYLVMKLEGSHLEHGGSGVRMPFGTVPLDDAQITIIRQWIEQGAKP